MISFSVHVRESRLRSREIRLAVEDCFGAKLPAQLVGPSHSNPFGHWEPARFLEINQEILGAIGRAWYAPGRPQQKARARRG
jgi:hypothetical protein